MIGLNTHNTPNLSFTSVSVKGGWHKADMPWKDNGFHKYPDGSIQERLTTVPYVRLVNMGNLVKKAADAKEHYEIEFKNDKNGLDMTSKEKPWKLITLVDKDRKFCFKPYKELSVERVTRYVDPEREEIDKSVNTILDHYQQKI